VWEDGVKTASVRYSGGSKFCAGDPTLVNCNRWMMEVQKSPMEIVLFGNELWQQFPVNAYGGIEASVETMAWGLHHLGIPFWVVTPGRGESRASLPHYPFSVLETQVAPNGQGGMVGEYVEQSLKIMRERKDAVGSTPHHQSNTSYPHKLAPPLIAWGQSDWSQAFSQGALVAVSTHHDGGGPVANWDRHLPNVGHRFLSVDQRKRWLTPENVSALLLFAFA